MPEVLNRIETSETLPPFTEAPGFQTRFRMGPEYLNKSTTLPQNYNFEQVQPEKQQQSFIILAAASTKERQDFWNTSDTPPEQRLQIWKDHTLKVLTSERNNDKMKHLQKFMSVIGVNETIQEKDIQNLYDSYCVSSPAETVKMQINGKTLQVESQIVAFAKDIVDTYTTSNGFDQETLKQDLPSIQWLARIFGTDSAEMITQILDSLDKKQEYFAPCLTGDKPKAEYDNLSDREKKWLDRLQPFTEAINRVDIKINNQYIWQQAREDAKQYQFTPEPDPKSPEFNIIKATRQDGNKIVEVIEAQDIIDLTGSSFSKTELHNLAEQNKHTAATFIKKIREVDKEYSSEYLNKQGLSINKSDGWFSLDLYGLDNNSECVNSAAQSRYKMPLGIYMVGAHARLITKGPYEETGQWYINVYDPMQHGLSTVKLSGSYTNPSTLRNNLMEDHIFFNTLFMNQVAQDQNNLEKNFQDKELLDFAGILFEAKFQQLQNDSKNCIPYCLYVAGMLNALKKGDTPFKAEGMQQFEEDFGIQFITYEEFTKKDTGKLLTHAPKIQTNPSVPPTIKIAPENKSTPLTEDIIDPSKSIFPQVAEKIKNKGSFHVALDPQTASLFVRPLMDEILKHPSIQKKIDDAQIIGSPTIVINQTDGKIACAMQIKKKAVFITATVDLDLGVNLRMNNEQKLELNDMQMDVTHVEPGIAEGTAKEKVEEIQANIARMKLDLDEQLTSAFNQQFAKQGLHLDSSHLAIDSGKLIIDMHGKQLAKAA